jgi:hypothetical protein
MITISKPVELPPEAIHKAIRHHGTKWCRLSCANPQSLLAFAALNGVAMKFFASGGYYLVPADMRDVLLKAGAEPA